MHMAPGAAATGSLLQGLFNYSQAALPNAENYIRLLQVQASSVTAESSSLDSHHTARIVCSISNTAIAKPCPFKALSYTWGSDQRTSEIELCGRTFPITASLDEALRHIRKRDEAVTVWIDQICINQSDDVEKTAQVSRMSEVYTRCEQVIVWLGPAADDSDRLMDCWQIIGQKARNLGIEQFYTRERIGELFALADNANPENPLTKEYQALQREARPMFEGLLSSMVAWSSRPWFQRVWVIQETALCSNAIFVCGYKTVNVDFVQLAGQIFQSAIQKSLQTNVNAGFRQLVGQASDTLPAQIFSIRRRRQNFHEGKGTGDELFHLLRKLFVGNDTRANQSRDRIYGLLGLAVDAERLGVYPDYVSKSETAIFASAALTILKSGRLELLSYSQFPKGAGLETLPTWAPDWRPMLEPSFYTIHEHAEDHFLRASGNTSVSVISSQASGVLGLRGFVIDVVEETGDLWLNNGHRKSQLACLKRIQQLCELSASKGQAIYPTPERREEACWRVPIGDLYWTPEDDYKRAKATSQQHYAECLTVLDILVEEETSGKVGNDRAAELALRRMGSGLYRNSMSAMSGKMPFMTRKGYVGMSAKTQPEDAVVIFCGSNIAHVLRPDGGEKFTYVGEAYCDGVMDGEIVNTGEERTFLLV